MQGVGEQGWVILPAPFCPPQGAHRATPRASLRPRGLLSRWSWQWAVRSALGQRAGSGEAPGALCRLLGGTIQVCQPEGLLQRSRRSRAMALAVPLKLLPEAGGGQSCQTDGHRRELLAGHRRPSGLSAGLPPPAWHRALPNGVLKGPLSRGAGSERFWQESSQGAAGPTEMGTISAWHRGRSSSIWVEGPLG